MGKCKYCDKEFVKYQSLGAHISSCKLNPNYDNNIKHKIETKKLKNPKSIYNLICIKCNTTYSLELTLLQFNKKEFNQHCTRTCANTHILSDETKEKIKNAVNSYNLQHNKTHIKKRCKKCDKEIGSYTKHGLCKQCVFKDPNYKLNLSLKCGGVRNVKGKYKSGYYNNIWMDSSWEILFAKKLDSLNIKWVKDRSFCFYYIINDIKRKYFPDFYLPDYNTYIEIKGFWTPENIEKMQLVRTQNTFKIKYIESVKEIENFTSELIN